MSSNGALRRISEKSDSIAKDLANAIEPEVEKTPSKQSGAWDRQLSTSSKTRELKAKRRTSVVRKHAPAATKQAAPAATAAEVLDQEDCRRPSKERRNADGALEAKAGGALSSRKEMRCSRVSSKGALPSDRRAALKRARDAKKAATAAAKAAAAGNL